LVFETSLKSPWKVPDYFILAAKRSSVESCLKATKGHNPNKKNAMDLKGVT